MKRAMVLLVVMLLVPAGAVGQDAPIADLYQFQDGASVAVLAVERDLEPVNENLPPAEGMQYVAALTYMAIPDGVAIDRYDYRYDEFGAIVASTAYEASLKIADVSPRCPDSRCPGDTLPTEGTTVPFDVNDPDTWQPAGGWVTFEVPADAERIDITFRELVFEDVGSLSDLEALIAAAEQDQTAD